MPFSDFLYRTIVRGFQNMKSAGFYLAAHAVYTVAGKNKNLFLLQKSSFIWQKPMLFKSNNLQMGGNHQSVIPPRPFKRKVGPVGNRRMQQWNVQETNEPLSDRQRVPVSREQSNAFPVQVQMDQPSYFRVFWKRLLGFD